MDFPGNLANILSNLPDALLVVDAHGKLLFAGKALKTILQHDPGQITGQTLFNFVHPQDRPLLKEMLNDIFQGAPGRREMLRLQTAGAEFRWLDIAGCLFSFAGFADCAIFSCRESKEPYRIPTDLEQHGIVFAMFNNLPGMVYRCSLDEKRTMEFVSNGCLELTGYAPAALEHNRIVAFDDLIHPADRTEAWNRILQAVETSRPYELEYRIFTARGEEKWVWDKGRSIKGYNNRLILEGFIADMTERARAEQALRQSEERHRAILKNIEEGYYEVDLEGYTTYINDSLLDVMGYKREDLIGAHYKKFSKNPEETFRVFNRVYRTGEPEKGFLWEYISATGQVRTMEFSISLIRDRDGNPTGFRGMARDITERIRMEEELRQSEERYRSILDSIEDGYYEVDLAGNHTMVNDSLLRIHDYTREELMGKSYKIFTKRPDVVYKIYNRIYKTGKPEKRLVWTYLSRTGEEKQIEVSASLIRDKDGRPVGFRGIVRDVTERARMVEQLRQSEERYRDIINSIEEGYYELDLDGRIVFCNDAMLKMVGYSKEELLSNSYRLLAENPEELFQIYSRVLQTGLPEKNIVWTLKSKDNKTLHIEISITLIKGKDGKPTGFRGIARDITERRKAEMEIRLQKTHLEALFAYSTDAIALFDHNEHIARINYQFTKLFGYSPEEAQGRKLKELIFGENGKENQAEIEAKCLHGESVEHELIRYDRHGTPIEVALKGVPVVVEGRVVGGYAIYSNITARKHYERQLEYMSMHDTLTGVYNRAYFEQEMLRLADGRDFPVSIMVVDVDDLKYINDHFGHNTGDIALKGCARILKQSARRRDVVARIGGDEFVLLLPNTTPDIVKEIIGRIERATERFQTDNPDIPLSFSIGAATSTDRHQDLMEVFKEADNRMYNNKAVRLANKRGGAERLSKDALFERELMASSQGDRMSKQAWAMGEKLGLPPEQLNSLTLLSRVHDIGKVAVPDHILFKPAKLTLEEWEAVKRHPEAGFQMALSCGDLKYIANLILYHHERWDGKGYPYGLKGEEIPIECRILAIVDSYDALTNARPYRPAMSPEQALAEIQRCAGTQFDPGLVEIFIEMMGATQPGPG